MADEEENTVVATENGWSQRGWSDEPLQIIDYPEEREGYLFNGWNTERDGSGTKYEPGDTIRFDNSITLYAQWLKIIDVTFFENPPEQFETVTITLHQNY